MLRFDDFKPKNNEFNLEQLTSEQDVLLRKVIIAEEQMLANTELINSLEKDNEWYDSSWVFSLGIDGYKLGIQLAKLEFELEVVEQKTRLKEIHDLNNNQDNNRCPFCGSINVIPFDHKTKKCMTCGAKYPNIDVICYKKYVTQLDMPTPKKQVNLAEQNQEYIELYEYLLELLQSAEVEIISYEIDHPDVSTWDNKQYKDLKQRVYMLTKELERVFR